MADIKSSADERFRESIKLVSDWTKWIIAVESGLTAFMGTLFIPNRGIQKIATPVKLFGSTAVCAFIISIVAAAILLLTLPEIMQKSHPDVNIWNTRDGVLNVRSESLAILEGIFFGVGIISIAAMIVTSIWT